MNTPRRPMVPGPADPQPTQRTISQQAIALREAVGIVERGGGGIGTGETTGTNARTSGLVQMEEVPAPRLNPAAKIEHGPVGKIASAIAAVMANVGTIKKGGWNAFHKYHYARMEDLLQAITPLMGQNGLAVLQDQVEIRNVEGNRIAVEYEFSVFHSSGEVWPRRLRHTGTANARDSKGQWDDKAIPKCHTQARKYFLLSLFQVPSGDFEDSDADEGPKEKTVIPGPKSTLREGASEEAKPITEDAKVRASQEAIKGRVPHKIVMPQGTTADMWASVYIKAISDAQSQIDITEWDKQNDDFLQRLSDRYTKIYEMIEATVNKRLDQLAQQEKKDDAVADSPAPMPDVKETTELMNWIAAQLASFKEYEAAEAFWNQKIAPLEKSLDIVDWELLMKEWDRTCARFDIQSQ